MSTDVSGSLRSFTIEGIPYNVAADANVSTPFSEYENTMVPSSGRPMRKMLKRVPSWEGVVLLVNASEREQIKSFAEGLDDVKYAGEFASGDIYRSEGTFEIDSFESEENRMTINVHPRVSWTLFPA